MEKIVVLDRATIAPHVNVRAPAFAHEWVDHDSTAVEQVTGRVADASILIVNKVRVNRGNLAGASRLAMIAVAATGLDSIDLQFCRERDIVVSNIRNYAVHTVPEHAFSMILALSRNLIGYREDVHAGQWHRSGQFCFFNEPVFDLHGKRLGIYGEGSIGQSVAALGRAFGMEVVFAAHKGVDGLGPLYTPFEEVVHTADVHTMHCPLLPGTRGMIGLPEFQQMKRSAIIINTARGGLIVEDDLVTAVCDRLIAGAALDVLASEPPADDHPLVQLSRERNFILTPHTAWASTEAMQTLSDQLIDNIDNFVAGSPSNVCT